MTSTLLQLRCSYDEKDVWVALAEASGLSLSEWVRRRLNAVPIAGVPPSHVTRPLDPGAWLGSEGFVPVASSLPVLDRPRPVVVAEPVGCSAFAPRGTKCKLCGKLH